MNTEPVPACWRSEAFAEDLADDDTAMPLPATGARGAGLLARLADLLSSASTPVTAAVPTWRSTAA